MAKPSPAIGSAEGQQSDLATELAQVLAPDVTAALIKWQDEFATSIVFDRWLVSGLSGAQVASVGLSGRVGPRKVVMKVCPPGQTTGREPGLHEKALKDAPPKFAERHLVRQLAACEGQGLVCDVPGDCRWQHARRSRSLCLARSPVAGSGCRRRVFRVGRLEPRA